MASDFDISVIVPCVNRYADLRDCLSALTRQEGARIEMIVIDRLGGEVRAALARDFPQAVLIGAGSETTIPQMRAMGHKAASADAVGVIEDHVIVPRDWARQMLDALAEGHDVVGGAIRNYATDNLMDWAAFLCEYSASLPPLPSGPAGGVPGNNVVYRKSVLVKYGTALDANRWENHLHDAMRADGVELIMRPDIVVGHKMHYTFWLYFSQRYLYSRSYAGMRVAGASMPKRIAMGCAAFALPPILYLRTVKTIRAKGAHLNELKRSLPLLAVFVVSWAAGEIAGYWFGPGRALSKVR